MLQKLFYILCLFISVSTYAGGESSSISRCRTWLLKSREFFTHTKKFSDFDTQFYHALKQEGFSLDAEAIYLVRQQLEKSFFDLIEIQLLRTASRFSGVNYEAEAARIAGAKAIQKFNLRKFSSVAEAQKFFNVRVVDYLVNAETGLVEVHNTYGYYADDLLRQILKGMGLPYVREFAIPVPLPNGTGVAILFESHRPGISSTHTEKLLLMEAVDAASYGVLFRAEREEQAKIALQYLKSAIHNEDSRVIAELYKPLQKRMTPKRFWQAFYQILAESSVINESNIRERSPEIHRHLKALNLYVPTKGKPIVLRVEPKASKSGND